MTKLIASRFNNSFTVIGSVNGLTKMHFNLNAAQAYKLYCAYFNLNRE